MSTTFSFTDTTGISAVGFYLPPNNIVKLDCVLLKFAYMQPVVNASGALYTRTNTALTGAPQAPTSNSYRTQTTDINTSNSIFNDWDDWYLYNRQNVKLGIFYSSDVNGTTYSTLSLSSAIVSL
jgi:hypothetical protein